MNGGGFTITVILGLCAIILANHLFGRVEEDSQTVKASVPKEPVLIVTSYGLQCAWQRRINLSGLSCNWAKYNEEH